MLAYVFWHWLRVDHDAAEYEQAERAFHSALREAAPRGFQGSLTFRVHGHAGWLGGAPAYADWYLVDDSAALDPLNGAAVSGPCVEPHTRLTRGMEARAGSLLALRGEHADVASARWVAWLVKPRDMLYDAFYGALDSTPGSLWRRQMVLGPTPEFALLAPGQLSVPETFKPVTLKLEPIQTD